MCPDHDAFPARGDMRPGRDAFPAKERETTHRKRQDVPVILSRQGGGCGGFCTGRHGQGAEAVQAVFPPGRRGAGRERRKSPPVKRAGEPSGKIGSLAPEAGTAGVSRTPAFSSMTALGRSARSGARTPDPCLPARSRTAAFSRAAAEGMLIDGAMLRVPPIVPSSARCVSPSGGDA